MRRVQGKKLVGFVTVHVQGKNPEFFFQACANAKIPVWDIKKTATNHCVGKIYLLHVKRVKEIVHQFDYEIQFKNRKGYVNYLLQMWTRKEIIASILLCCLIIFILSNIVWKVNITGVSVDVEKKINKQLTSYGLYEGAWAYSLESLDIIQQDVLHAVPELLYIGIQKKGTTYHVDGVEKLIIEEEEKGPAQHLKASKSGVIEKMFVKKGLPVVEVNDFVSKGDLLVSGVINEQKQDGDNSEQEIAQEAVGAEGDVYANTWYEVTVSSSLHSYHEKLSGEKMRKYDLKFGTVQIPVWGFKKVPFDRILVEKEEKPLYFLKWELPIQFIQHTIYNKSSFQHTRSKEEAKQVAIDHVKEDIQRKLGTDAEIQKYYVLHETEENGKVKLNLYISVLENIAKGTPVH